MIFSGAEIIAVRTDCSIVENQLITKSVTAKLLSDKPLELIIIHKDSDDYREDSVASTWGRIQH